MIADTTFVSDLLKEQRLGWRGAATDFFIRSRPQKIRTTIITAGELLVMFERSADAWTWLEAVDTLPAASRHRGTGGGN